MLHDGARMPRGLALDLQEGRMYWAEDGTMKLRSATLDGQDLRDVPVAKLTIFRRKILVSLV